MQLCLFVIDKAYYALPAVSVKSIQPFGEITYVPGCPPEILGVIHLKGRIEAIVDLRVLLGIEQREPMREDKIMMISQDHVRSGLLVDSAEDILWIHPDQIRKVPSGFDKTVQAFATGVITWKKQTAVLLSPELIMDRIQGASQ